MSDYSQCPGPVTVQVWQSPCSNCDSHDEALSEEQANVGRVSQEVIPEDRCRETSWLPPDNVTEHSH